MGSTDNHNRNLKLVVLAVLIGGILALHYLTLHEKALHHAVYRMLFYLPLVLGSFWFGLRGAAGVSAAVALFYLPFVYQQWRGIDRDFSILLEGALYVFIALVLGHLSEKERREQAARVEAERLAGIGRAVAEIAHDMKSPLMAIGGFVTQVSRKLPSDDPGRKKLDLVVRETSRLESMVREMLDFGRPLELRKSAEDLNRLVEDCVEACRPIADKQGVEIRTELGPDLPPLALDRNRFNQVVMNLITNAVQASASGETVLARTRREGDEAVLDLRDHGRGIREEDRDKVFEPFVSTKKGGTGLGLPIVKKIVEAHGGRVLWRANPEGGVTFSVRQPANKGTMGGDAAARDEAA